MTAGPHSGLFPGPLNSWLANFAMWCHARWMWCGSVVRAQIAKRRTKRLSRQQGTRWISRLFTMFSCSFWLSSFVPWKLEDILVNSVIYSYQADWQTQIWKWWKTGLRVLYPSTFKLIHHYNTKQWSVSLTLYGHIESPVFPWRVQS